MYSKVGMQSKVKCNLKWNLSLNDVVFFKTKNNANTFCRLFSNLADWLQQKILRQKNKFGIRTTEEYFNHIRNECEDFDRHYLDVTTIDEILKNLGAVKATGIDQDL